MTFLGPQTLYVRKALQNGYNKWNAIFLYNLQIGQLYDYKLGTRLLHMYKVIKKCAKREPKNKINEQPCTYVQINVVHKCRKMWKPYREPFESLTITNNTKTF